MNNEVKQNILNEIEKNSLMFTKINPIQYRIRCPICGDTNKDPTHAHCYIKCSMDPTEPLLYHCKLNNCKGVVNRYFLEKLNIDKKVIGQLINYRYNKLSSDSVRINISDMEPILNSPQTEYIEGRLGNGFTFDDYSKFRIVWDIDKIREYITDKRVLNTLPSNRDSISFLSDDQSLMLTRPFTDGSGLRWIKKRLYNTNNGTFYTIKSTINLFAQDKIVINIAEGIFDVLSIYKNFNDCENSIFIAALGSDYISCIEYMIGKGFAFGDIDLRIYIDQGNYESSLKKSLKKYKWLFNSITLYTNTLYKDVGVSIDRISLKEIRI